MSAQCEWYENSVKKFKQESDESVAGKLCLRVHFDSVEEQKKAWREEVKLLKTELKTTDGRIVFEYPIPRIGKRPDVVLLLHGIIFVLEFKVGANSYDIAARKQVRRYAEYLSYFHDKSHGRIIVPILVSTEARNRAPKLEFRKETIYNELCCNSNGIWTIVAEVLKKHRAGRSCRAWENAWCQGRYKLLPGIIDAVVMRYHNHNVRDIRNASAGVNELTATTRYILNKIKDTQENKEKAIFFVTGVPGAGKTLVGLDVVAETHKEYKSVFLSGNKPLVDVLQAELAEDAKQFVGDDESDAVIKGASMIQLIHEYRKQTIRKIAKIVDGKLVAKKVASAGKDCAGSVAEPEHVVVFDEAQRAWDRDRLRKPGRGGKTILCNPSFPYSEPAFLIWSMDQRNHDDWAVIVCLVGGGQEINKGEAGILEWVKAVRDEFDDWKVYISPNLNLPEYAGTDLKDCLDHVPQKVVNKNLHLAVSKRAIRSENVSLFVKALIDRDVRTATTALRQFSGVYPIKITRSLEKAKSWLRKQMNSQPPEAQPQRCGALMSSKGYRLRPYGFEIKSVGEYKDIAKWFLGDRKNVNSSNSLEVAVTEFFVQGLELDWTLVCWDADFRYSEESKDWECYNGFDGEKWQLARGDAARRYKCNAYRVLLTRARRGMVIFVPQGRSYDSSRKKEFYDSTYNYLKAVGLDVL